MAARRLALRLCYPSRKLSLCACSTWGPGEAGCMTLRPRHLIAELAEFFEVSPSNHGVNDRLGPLPDRQLLASGSRQQTFNEVGQRLINRRRRDVVSPAIATKLN